MIGKNNGTTSKCVANRCACLIFTDKFHLPCGIEQNILGKYFLIKQMHTASFLLSMFDTFIRWLCTRPFLDPGNEIHFVRPLTMHNSYTTISSVSLLYTVRRNIGKHCKCGMRSAQSARNVPKTAGARGLTCPPTREPRKTKKN